MVSEVIRMSKENVPAETIVNKMRDSRAVYRLNAAQLAQLHDQGVADRVSCDTRHPIDLQSGLRAFLAGHLDSIRDHKPRYFLRLTTCKRLTSTPSAAFAVNMTWPIGLNQSGANRSCRAFCPSALGKCGAITFGSR